MGTQVDIAEKKEHTRVETSTVSAFHAELMEDKEVLDRWKNLKTILKNYGF